MKIKLILLLLAIFSLCTVIYLVGHEEEPKAYVLTEIGCLKTHDTITEFENRQKLMADMNLPVYQRCR